MSNNYTISNFWKGWHSSYNKWLIRYLYIPLGGSSYRYINVWVIFIFVAIWHDIEFKLLMWALLNSIFLVAEYIGTYLSTSPTLHHYGLRGNVKKSCSVLCGAVYIVLLVGVNLIGKYCSVVVVCVLYRIRGSLESKCIFPTTS